MIPTASDPVSTLVFFLVVFGVVGAFFLFIHLVMGSVIRPNRPDAEKLTIYECGEPTVGSAWIQFDLRFYVVALLFVIFDVEVAFFFPWATVFGTANQLSNLQSEMSQLHLKEKELKDEILQKREVSEESKARQDKIDDQLAGLQEKQRLLSEKLKPSGLTDEARLKMGLSRVNKTTKKIEMVPIEPKVAGKWAMVAFFDILIFFAVLMVGFAYVWRRGDIDWVRAYAHHKEPAMEKEMPLEQKVGV